MTTRSEHHQPLATHLPSLRVESEMTDGATASVERPTMRDVARYAGVSQATVSNVLNHPDRVASSRQQAVNSAITDLGFVRHEGARQLRSGHSKTLGLLLLDAWNPAFQDMARGVEETTNAAGWSLLIANSARELERERTYLRLFAETRVPGMIVIPHDDLANTPHQVNARGVNVVVVDRSNSWNHSPSVAVDDVAGGRLAANHLINLGHRELLFAGDASTAAPVHNRFTGIQQAAGEAPQPVRVRQCSVPLTIEGGRVAGEHFVAIDAASRPTAILAAVDAVAIGVIHTLLQHGISVPDDVSVIGYDDVSLAQVLPVPLTTVHRPHLEMGQSAARLLLESLAGHAPAQQKVVFQPELVIRSSTKAVEVR